MYAITSEWARPALKPRSPLNTLVGVFGYAHTCNSETGGCEKKASLQFRKDMLPYLKSAAMPCAFQTDLTDSLYMKQNIMSIMTLSFALRKQEP